MKDPSFFAHAETGMSAILVRIEVARISERIASLPSPTRDITEANGRHSRRRKLSGAWYSPACSFVSLIA